MRAPLAWLRDYVELPRDPGAIVAKLATLGFPVETVEARPVISGVVVGTIEQLAKHPNADRLGVCTLDVGAPEKLTIVTAATNVAPGQVVPVAAVGARLPQLTIEPRKMRGIASQGMLCSAEELGLPPDWFEDGIMQLDPDAPNGADVVHLFGLDAPVFDIEIVANRGDALSMIGVARELAAGFGVQLRMPPTFAREAAGALDPNDVRVTLESLDVRRYVTQRVSQLTVRRAPAWIRVRLALAGQRPISNLVDISNFVMLEVGQPLHFFDYEKIGGKHIIVRDAREHEFLTTLDGIARELDPVALVIADDGRPTGLAGLMGGLVSEVSATTREIVIESANFAGPRIRRMSLRLGLRTEASTRNEKNLALALTDLGAARAAYLLEREGGIAHPARAYGPAPLASPTIELAERDVERLLGFAVSPAHIQGALEALGFGVALVPGTDGTRFAVTVPSWRADIAIAADLVEEIARIIGYDRVRAEIPPILPTTLSSDAFERDMKIASTLAGLGYYECLTLALQPAGVAQRWRSFGLDVPPVVEIRNPLSADQRFMRFSLLPALLEHAARHRVRPLRTFEIGHVFSDAPEAPEETNVVTLLATTRPGAGQPAWRDAAFLAVSSDVTALVRSVTGTAARLERGTAPGLHPGKTARLFVGERAVGYVGTVDPRLVQAADIAGDAVAGLLYIDALPAPAVRRHVSLSKFPAIERDLALIVDPGLPAGTLQSAIAAASDLVRRADVFDEYRGPQIGADKKSLAVRIVLQRDDATLTDAEADRAIATIVSALHSAYGAFLRE